MLLKIPIRLVSESNSSEHWTKSSKRHKLQKLIVKSYLFREVLPPLPCTITLTRHAPRPFDVDDNLPTSFKYVKDQISETMTNTTLAGRADSDPRMKWVYKQEKTKDKEHFVTIDIVSDFETVDINEGYLLDHIY